MQLSMVSDDGAVMRVKVKGQVTQNELTAATCPLKALLGGDYSRRVLLDLSEANFLDSSGVGWLLSTHQQFRANGGVMAMHSIHANSRKVLKVLKMELVLNLFDAEKNALDFVHSYQPQAPEGGAAS